MTDEEAFALRGTLRSFSAADRALIYATDAETPAAAEEYLQAREAHQAELARHESG